MYSVFNCAYIVSTGKKDESKLFKEKGSDCKLYRIPFLRWLKANAEKAGKMLPKKVFEYFSYFYYIP